MTVIVFLLIAVLFFVAPITTFVYIMSDLLKDYLPAAREIYQTLLPVGWIASLICAVARVIIMMTPDHEISFWDYVLIAMYLWIARDAYKSWKRDGDGRWKKKLKSALARVKNVGHKLVVVVEPEPNAA